MRNIITGLTLGADDYIGKPFSARESVLRVEAVLRRSQKMRDAQHELIVAEGIAIDTRTLLGKHGLRSCLRAPGEVDLEYLQRNDI